MMSIKHQIIKILRKHNLEYYFPVAVHQTAFLEAMKKANAFWPDAHSDPKLMANLSISAFELANFAGLVIPFDITAEAEAMGAKVKMGTKTTLPTVIKPINSIDEINNPEPNEGRLGVIGEATAMLEETFGDEQPIIESVGGPFTIATLLLGIDRCMSYLFKEQDEIDRILELTTETVITFNKYLIEQGADIITLLEPVSSLLGPIFFKRFSLPYLKKAISRIKIKVPVILHICGDTTPILDLIRDTGADGFSFDQKTPLAQAVEKLKGRVTLIGNLDPVNVLWKAEPEKIIDATINIIRDGIDIPSPGCGLPPYTPAKNLQAFTKTVWSYNSS